MKSSRYNLIPDDQQIGQRVDHVLARAMTTLSRSRIQRLIESANVLVNGQPVKPSYKLKPGDKLEIDIPPPEPTQFLPENLTLNIIYEDDDLLIINKPAGLVVHPGAGVRSGTLANALAYHYQQLSSLSGQVRPGIVHRLDKQTSGLLVVAKNDEAHLKLAEQWRRREVEKTYLGLVYGVPAPAQGKIEAPIGRHPTERIKMAVRPEGKGRQAVTLYRVVEAFADTALIEVQIKTGRTHQIRVHLAYMRHPIVGDDVYGSSYKTKLKNPIIRQAVDQLGRYFLHAARLRFRHPRTNESLAFQADLPDDLQQLLMLLRSS